MGKHRQKHGHGRLRSQEQEEDSMPSSAYDPPPRSSDDEKKDHEEEALPECLRNSDAYHDDPGLKHFLYQRAVQSPAGEISYFQKFFLTYVGGRVPLHLREDFCGTALICAEWVRTDPRRTALGLDLDEEALKWGISHNISKLQADAQQRICLLHGNVLCPLLSADIMLGNALEVDGYNKPANCQNDEGTLVCKAIEDLEVTSMPYKKVTDIICALNFSCCCLGSRKDLVAYFKLAFDSITRKGGIFVMDLYGGVSSERSLKFKRHFSDFVYTWEQEEFDTVKRTTRISLHFQLNKQHKKTIRHAFSYKWRLWTIPEVKECLEEAGFTSTHCWIREMDDLPVIQKVSDVNENKKFHEVETFLQCDSWNAYIIGVK